MKREDIVLQDAGAGKGKRIAIFPGAFDPFTKGHASLVERGLLMVDEIIIAIGINGNKKNCFPLEERLAAIRELYKADSLSSPARVPISLPRLSLSVLFQNP